MDLSGAKATPPYAIFVFTWLFYLACRWAKHDHQQLTAGRYCPPSFLVPRRNPHAGVSKYTCLGFVSHRIRSHAHHVHLMHCRSLGRPFEVTSIYRCTCV